MKDQYTGDINDYCKYALLRAVSVAHPGSMAVCWMLTVPDRRSDGVKTSYLDEPESYRSFDAPLFDALASLVARETRSVEAVQTANVLPAARFYSGVLLDPLDARSQYFDTFFQTLGQNDLVFFDPDNGLEVSSVRKGRRNSSKYLYWDELTLALDSGRAVCVYQHFPRRPRAEFLGELLDQMSRLLPGHRAFAVKSSWVAYLFCAPNGSVDVLRNAAAEVVERSGSLLTLSIGPM